MRRDNSRIITIPPSKQQRVLARSQFADLLNSETTEHDWQRFFNENPFVFAESLPIHYDALYKHVPLLAGTPDYVFNTKSRTPGVGSWGVIELKRPDDAIIGSYSSKILMPSRKLVAAHQQTKQYLRAIEQGLFCNPHDFFVAGNRKHAFIIIGLSTEIRKKCNSEELRTTFRDFLPMGVHIFTYDEMCETFSERVGCPIVVLVARPQKVSVLMVSEDEAGGVRSSLTCTFSEIAGWEVINTRHGKEIIPAYRAAKLGVDVIVLHHNYVYSEGWNIPRVLKEIAKEGIATPIIVVNTNHSTPRDWMLSLGVHRWIEIPCPVIDLCGEITNVVATYRKVRT